MATKKKTKSKKSKAKPKRKKARAKAKNQSTRKSKRKVAKKPRRASPKKAKRPAKVAAKRKPVVPAQPPPPGKEVGFVTHYFGEPSVAVIKLKSGTLRVGDTIHIRGHTTDFEQRVESLQVDHAAVTEV